jgi:hypothetical protein
MRDDQSRPEETPTAPPPRAGPHDIRATPPASTNLPGLTSVTTATLQTPGCASPQHSRGTKPRQPQENNHNQEQGHPQQLNQINQLSRPGPAGHHGTARSRHPQTTGPPTTNPQTTATAAPANRPRQPPTAAWTSTKIPGSFRRGTDNNTNPACWAGVVYGPFPQDPTVCSTSTRLPHQRSHSPDPPPARSGQRVQGGTGRRRQTHRG